MKMIQVLTEQELRSISEACFRLLENTGIIIHEPTLAARLADAGARLDPGSHRVRLPRTLVEWALRTAPREVTLCGRSPEVDIHLGGGGRDDLYYLAGNAGDYVYDPERKEHRPALLKDLSIISRIVDALPGTNGLVTPVLPADIPIDTRAERICVEVFRNSRKHFISLCNGRRSARNVIEIASMIAGGLGALVKRPIVTVNVNPISPLILDRTQAENLIEFSQAGLPVTFGSAAMGGATSPVTLAGTLVIGMSESLAAVTCAQLVAEGSPVILKTATTCMDLPTGSYPAGAIERCLLGAADVQMIRHYGLPAGSVPGVSDSKVMDEQCGYEKAFGFLFLALACSNMVLGGGAFDSMFSMSFEQLLIDDEMIAMIRRLTRGIEVSDETIALELIDEKGPGGNFLDAAHTLAHMRNEVLVPKLGKRISRGQWYAEGANDIARSATHRKEEILGRSRVGLIDPLLDRELEKYLARVSQ